MLSMMPGTGMGAAGTGMGQSPQLPQGLNPQLLAMLAQMQTGGQTPGGPMVQAPPGPMGQPPTGTPMAGYIGAGGNMAGMMQHPMGMPQNPAQGPGGAGIAPGLGATPGQAAGGINPNIMALIQAMRGQQGGVPAMNGGYPHGNANTGAGMIANPFNGMTPLPTPIPPMTPEGAAVANNPFGGMSQ